MNESQDPVMNAGVAYLAVWNMAKAKGLRLLVQDGRFVLVTADDLVITDADNLPWINSTLAGIRKLDEDGHRPCGRFG